MRTFLAVGACLVLAACSPAKSKYTALPVNELMAHVVDPAAKAFWTGAGTEISREGIRDLSPTTEEGWKHVEDGAAGLIQAGNVLQLAGQQKKPYGKWDAHARKLSAFGVVAKEAVETRDKERLLDLGMELDGICEACHVDYKVGQTPPA